MMYLSNDNQADVIDAFNTTSRYLDDILNIYDVYFDKMVSKKGCKDQESIQSSTTPDPGYQWESDKLTVRHHKREPNIAFRAPT